MKIQTKRIYDEPAESDGRRVLVDRLWPRGLSREKARIDHWIRDVAPSDELRKWFGHDPARWDAFKQRYFEELDKNDAVDELLAAIKGEDVTFLFSAKDVEHNNAVALREYIERRARAGA